MNLRNSTAALEAERRFLRFNTNSYNGSTNNDNNYHNENDNKNNSSTNNDSKNMKNKNKNKNNDGNTISQEIDPKSQIIESPDSLKLLSNVRLQPEVHLHYCVVLN